MNRKLLKVIFTICLFGCSIAHAQIHKASIGVGGTGTYYFGDFKKLNPGLQVRLTYDIGQYGMVNLGYLIGAHYTSRQRYNPENKPLKQQLNLPFEIKDIDFKTLYLNYHYFIGNDDQDVFGIYLIGGANFTSVKVSRHFETTVDGNTHVADSLSLLNSAFGLNGGIGSQVRKGHFVIFLEFNSAIPVSIWSKQKISNDITISCASTLGLRFYLGGNPKFKKEKKRSKINPNM